MKKFRATCPLCGRKNVKAIDPQTALPFVCRHQAADPQWQRTKRLGCRGSYMSVARENVIGGIENFLAKFPSKEIA